MTEKDYRKEGEEMEKKKKKKYSGYQRLFLTQVSDLDFEFEFIA